MVVLDECALDDRCRSRAAAPQVGKNRPSSTGDPVQAGRRRAATTAAMSGFTLVGIEIIGSRARCHRFHPDAALAATSAGGRRSR